MAKKAKVKKTTKTAQSTRAKAAPNVDEANVPVSKQTAGAVTGAVLGGVVGGPLGALAGGAVGAMVGDSSAKGKKPIKRAVNAVREELTSDRAKEAVAAVSTRIRSLSPFKKKKKAVSKTAGHDEYSRVPSLKKKAKGTKSPKSAKTVTYAPKKTKKKAKKKS